MRALKIGGRTVRTAPNLCKFPLRLSHALAQLLEGVCCFTDTEPAWLCNNRWLRIIKQGWRQAIGAEWRTSHRFRFQHAWVMDSPLKVPQITMPSIFSCTPGASQTHTTHAPQHNNTRRHN